MLRTSCHAALPIVALLALVAGCQQPAREAQRSPPMAKAEVVEEHWPNGVLRLRKEVLRSSDGTVVDHGSYESWYDNGQIEYQGTFVQGKADGIARRFHRNGQKSVEESLAKGMRQGPRFSWDEGGVLRKEEHFTDDLPDGVWTTWDDKGKIKAQQRFERGVPKP
jgi:antitoxin component YwqK of YwqJK toxin-antitoxin module